MPAPTRAIRSLMGLLLLLGLTMAAAPSASAATSSLAWGGFSNGRIPASAICVIPWQTEDSLRCDATSKLVALNKVYKAKWGTNICVSDGYRSYTKQVALFKQYGSPRAAKPGTSTHGWGLAVDFGCGIGAYAGAKYKWLAVVGPKYGYGQPDWAKQKGSNPEPWHWQFFGPYNTSPPKATPAPAKAATTTIINFTGTWPVTATATVRNKVTGKGLAGVPVTIKRRAAGASTYTTVGTYKTNAFGRVGYAYRPNTPTLVLFSYAGGSATLPSAGSATMTTSTVLWSGTEKGKPNRLVGRLLTPSGKAVPSQSVHLQRLDPGGKWATVSTSLKTSSTGYVAVTVQPKRKTYYRFYFPGQSGKYVKDYSANLYVSY